MRKIVTPAMTPEDELCLLLARGRLNSKERTRVRQSLTIPLPWPLILERAYSHQVYPPLYRNLLELGFPGVPEAVQTELKSAYLANAFRNQLFAEELARLLKLLGEAGIPVIPLKGVTLAQSLFGDPARPGLLRHRYSGAARRCGTGAQCHPQEWDTAASSPRNFSSITNSAPRQIVHWSLKLRC